MRKPKQMMRWPGITSMQPKQQKGKMQQIV